MWQKNVRYLDYNATSGVNRFVRDHITDLLRNSEILVNPSSRHRPGQFSRALLYTAQEQVSQKIFAKSGDEITFTSSGTESNQTILRSVEKKVDRLIIGAGEHSASFDWIDEIIFPKIRELPLLPSGEYCFTALDQLLRQAHEDGLKRVGLSLTLANNETGVRLDLEKLNLCLLPHKETLKIILHLDGAQAIGKMPLQVYETGADHITFSSHKIGAFSGTGFIWSKQDSSFSPLIPGSQAKGLRGGSENLLGLVATGVAAQHLNFENFTVQTFPLREELEKGLKSLPGTIKIWGEDAKRIPNTSRFSFQNDAGQNYHGYENWVELLDLKGYAVSHGSACKAQVIEPSRVLLKMGASKEEALNSIRVSFGPENTSDDVKGVLQAIKEVLEKKGNKK